MKERTGIFITQSQRRKAVDMLRAKGMMVPYGCSMKALAKHVAAARACPLPASMLAQGDMVYRFLDGVLDCPAFQMQPLKPPTAMDRINAARCAEYRQVVGFTDKLRKAPRGTV